MSMIWRKQQQPIEPTVQQQQQCYDDCSTDDADWWLQRWDYWLQNSMAEVARSDKVVWTRPQEWWAWPARLPPPPQQQQQSAWRENLERLVGLEPRMGSSLVVLVPCVLLLAVVSFFWVVLLLWRRRRRGGLSQQQQQQRRTGLDAWVEPPHARLRSDSGASLLFPVFPSPHQRGRRDRSGSSLDLLVQQLQQQQQQHSPFHPKKRLNTWSSMGRQQKQQRRPRTRLGVLPTSQDNFRDADVLEEDLEWITSDLLEHMVDFEERTGRWASLSSSSVASPPAPRHRARSSSTDTSLLPTSSSSSRRYQQQSAATLFQLWGPGIHTITYQTVTPPPTWTEASRRLLITDVAWQLAREVSLHLTTPTALAASTTSSSSSSKTPSLPQLPVGTALLVIQPPPQVVSSTNLANDPTTASAESTPDWVAYRKKQQQQKLKELERHAFRRPVTDCSLHVHRPAAGGVLEIYETTARGNNNNNNNPWMEQLFPTAAEAAQFQLDFMALQVLGPTLHNMYQALVLLHQGSPTFVGEEPVLQEGVGMAGSGIHHSNSGPLTDEASTVVMSEASPSPSSEPQPQQPGKKRRDDSRPVLDQDSGVAWDDVMRCLGSSFPSLRLRLEAIWWWHVHGVPVSAARTRTLRKKDAPPTSPVTSSAMGGGTAYLTPDYYDDSSSRSRRRLLLGPVDFFRLFVPLLPETAVPAEESHRGRMEQWIRWRKRAARASVLVQAYTRARTVVNLGWNVAGASTASLNNQYWKRRWAYDDESGNRQRDAYAKNEYYECTVSRDVMALVRGAAATTQETEPKMLQSNQSRWWWSRQDRDDSIVESAALSLYQGFSLVGMHAFQWPGCAAAAAARWGEQDYYLHPSKDPVQSIPSLHQLIGAHPELDFFVHAYSLEAQQAVIVKCFVRSLPKGIDPRFDTVVHRYFEGDAVLRDRKLEVILQLGANKDAITLWGRCLLWWLSFLLRLSRRHNVRPTGSTSHTTSIPALRVAECGETHHFGGSLQTDTSLPTNYVASTIHMEYQHNMSFTTRLLLSYVEFGGLAGNVSDFTYVIAGEAPDELPERALGMARVVRSTLHTLPMSCISLDSLDFTGGATMDAIEPPKLADQDAMSLYLKIFVMDPLVVAIKSMIRWVKGIRSVRGAVNPATPLTALLRRSPRNRNGSLRASIVATATDPVERAINELINILEGVKVPVRRCRDYDSPEEHHSPSDDSVVSGISALAMQSGDFIEQSILNIVSRETIQRYFIASDCSLRTASVRLIESTTWRAATFPIDTRTCRIELQTGQFFQQGKDLDGNPVFYFRNTCLGPWRKDEDAVIAAVLHRLETSLEALAGQDPLVQCTLIVMMGRPYRRKKKSTKHLKKDPELSSVDPKSASALNVSAASSVDGWEEVSDAEDHEGGSFPPEQTNNPRVFRDEIWNPHTSRPLIERLLGILLAHYPERLSKALVVLGHKNKRYVRSIVGGVLALASVVPSSKTRDKVRFLAHYSELQTFVDRSELVSLVGGSQSEDMKHYECR